MPGCTRRASAARIKNHCSNDGQVGCGHSMLELAIKEPHLPQQCTPQMVHCKAAQHLRGIFCSNRAAPRQRQAPVSHTRTAPAPPHLYSITPSRPGRFVVSKHAANASAVRTRRRPVPRCLLFLSIHSPVSSCGCCVIHAASRGGGPAQVGGGCMVGARRVALSEACTALYTCAHAA